MKKSLKKFSAISLLVLFITLGFVKVYASTIPSAPAVFETSLASPVAKTDTSMTLVSGLMLNGNALSGYTCFTVDSGTPNLEFICGTATGTAITSLVRGVDPLDGHTSDAQLIFSHRRGADVKITDYPVFSILRNILNGSDTLPNIISYFTHPAFNANTQLVDKQYVDAISVAGAPDASTITKGVTRLSASPNITLGNPTITIASPAVITLNSHGLTANDSVQFTTTGALPTGISASTQYYVISAGLTTNAFEISATLGGSAINTSGSQSGTHTLIVTTPVCVAPSDTKFNLLLTTNQQNALAGQSGTAPSSSNKLEDNADTSATASASKVYRLKSSGKIDATMLEGALPALDGSALTGIVGGYAGAITNTSSSTNQNIDTTFTTGFTAKLIIVRYQIDGQSNGGGTQYSGGTAVYDGTGTLVANFWDYKESASSTVAITRGTQVWDTVAPHAGTASGTPTIVPTLTITSVTSSGFTVRAAYTGAAGSITGHANFEAVAS